MDATAEIEIEDDDDPSLLPTPAEAPASVEEAHRVHVVARQRAKFAAEKHAEAERHKGESLARLESALLNLSRARRSFDVDRDINAVEEAEKLVKFARLDVDNAGDRASRSAKFLADAKKNAELAERAVEGAKIRVARVAVERCEDRHIVLVLQLAENLRRMNVELNVGGDFLAARYRAAQRVTKALLEHGMEPSELLGWLQ